MKKKLICILGLLFLLVYAGLAGTGAKLQLDAAQEFRQMKAALERGEEIDQTHYTATAPAVGGAEKPRPESGTGSVSGCFGVGRSRANQLEGIYFGGGYSHAGRRSCHFALLAAKRCRSRQLLYRAVCGILQRCRLWCGSRSFHHAASGDQSVENGAQGIKEYTFLNGVIYWQRNLLVLK